MGVKGLWKLLEPCGRRIHVETLENTTLAVDVSIWITQFVKAMRDEEGRPIKNAHVIGTLRPRPVWSYGESAMRRARSGEQWKCTAVVSIHAWSVLRASSR